MNNFYEWLSRKVPRRFLYWCVIRAWVLLTTEKYTDRTPDEVSVFDALEYLY